MVTAICFSKKHCDCPLDKVPVCCHEGFKLPFAGSSFTKGAEIRYSPTEGEALAVAYSLEHARMFVLGCNDLIVSTDHEPLLGLLNDRDLSKMPSKRLLNLKQRTLYYRFKIQYNPGKWHRGPDACSRNPVLALAILSDTEPFIEELELESHIESVVASIISSPKTVGNLVSFEDLLQIASSDQDYQMVKQAVSTGL